MDISHRYRKLIYLVLATAIAIGGVVFLAGCGVGRGDAGEVIIGFKAGELVETTGQALHAGLGLLPAPWGTIAGYFVTALTGVAGAYGVAKSRQSVATDLAYDQGRNETLALLGTALAARPVPVHGYATTQGLDPVTAAGAASSAGVAAPGTK